MGTANSNSYFYIPFLKESKPSKKPKEKRQGSLFNSGLYEEKKTVNVRSIDTRKIATAKSTSKRVVISSSKNLFEEKKMPMAVENIYF